MVVPAKLIVMAPPQLHMHCDELFNAGLLPIITVGDPGAQGAAITGMHGIGVSTPRAAAVAAATIGLANDWHMPNGGMFTIGMLSMIVAAGLLSIRTMACGITFSVLGATPNEHIIMPVLTTGWPIAASYPASLVD